MSSEENGRDNKVEIDFKNIAIFADINGIFKPILDYVISGEYKAIMETCEDSKESAFRLGLAIAPSIIWRDAPKFIIDLKDLNKLIEACYNTRVKNTSTNEEGA